MNYGQFCPIAKAAEILAEKWTILIIRELLMGGRRFGELAPLRTRAAKIVIRNP